MYLRLRQQPATALGDMRNLSIRLSLSFSFCLAVSLSYHLSVSVSVAASSSVFVYVSVSVSVSVFFLSLSLSVSLSLSLSLFLSLSVWLPHLRPTPDVNSFPSPGLWKQWSHAGCGSTRYPYPDATMCDFQPWGPIWNKESHLAVILNKICFQSGGVEAFFSMKT